MVGQNRCKNCESDLKPSHHYCPNCGQKTADDLTIGVLFNNTISNFFSVDARFFKSFVPLMFKPGVLARQFVDGKRLRYLHPAQFYLFISVVFFFLFSLATRQQQMNFNKAVKKSFETEIKDSISIKDLNLDLEDTKALKNVIADNNVLLDSLNMGEVEVQMQEFDSILNDTTTLNLFSFSANKTKLDSLIEINASKEEKLALFGITEEDNRFKRLITGQGLKIYERRGGGILGSFYDTIPISMFFLLPIFALILKMLYLRTGTFAHHIVFSFYYFTFMFMVLSFITLLNLLWNIPSWVDVIILSSTFLYLIMALWRFYRQHFVWTLFKTGVLTFIYLLIVLPISMVFMFFVSFLTY